MDGKRQFTLRYLLLEMLWIGLALGITRLAVIEWFNYFPSAQRILFLVLSAGLVCWGAAVGGLFGQMRFGVLASIVLIAVWFLCEAISDLM